MTCEFCRGPLGNGRRWCSKRCRQAGWRWKGAQAAMERAREPKRLAVADPPYPGRAHLYRDHRDYGGEVDHAALLERLQTYDGWALATDERGLQLVVPVLADLGSSYRIGIWVRGGRTVPSRQALRGWEAVVYHAARDVEPDSPPVRDTLIHHAQVCSTLGDERVVGAKPPAWSAWVWTLLGACPGDDLDDLFPGSGAVSRAWAAFNTRSMEWISTPPI